MRIAFFPGSREGGQFDTACTKRRAKAWTKKKTWKRLLRSPWKNYTIEVFFKTFFDSLVYNFPSQCPPDEDLNDFLANHVVDFYTRAKLVSQWTKRFIHFYLSISFHQKIVFHVQVYSTVLIFFRFTARWWTPRRRWCGLATIRTARSWTEDLSGDLFFICLFYLFIYHEQRT